MDAKSTSDPNVFILTLSLSEAKDIGQLVDNFRHWEMIADAENKGPMLFMLEFGRECKFAADGFGAMVYPIESGHVHLSPAQVATLSAFIKACVDMDGDCMPWAQRNYLTMAWKTLGNRLPLRR